MIVSFKVRIFHEGVSSFLTIGFSCVKINLKVSSYMKYKLLLNGNPFYFVNDIFFFAHQKEKYWLSSSNLNFYEKY